MLAAHAYPLPEIYVCPPCYEKSGLRTVSEYFLPSLLFFHSSYDELLVPCLAMYFQAISCRRIVHSSVVCCRAPLVEQQSTKYVTTGSHGVSERPSTTCRLTLASAGRFAFLPRECIGGAAAVYFHIGGAHTQHCFWISLCLTDAEKSLSMGFEIDCRQAF